MSHSLILPQRIGQARHLERQREAALKDPGVEVNKRPVPTATYDDAFFEAEKARIRERVGPELARIRVTLNHVLVCIYVRPKETASKIVIPDSILDDDVYRGTAGLVLKLGPRCFEDSSVLTWTEADKFAEDDWVMFRRGDANGFRVSVNGVECISFENERGIKLIVPRPDLFY